jgi:RNA polymerase sigma-70 factor, ECF subfamily
LTVRQTGHGSGSADAAPAPDEITEPSEPRARELLEQYIAAFENADTAMLKRALRHDAILVMVGSRTWFACQPVAA